MFVTRRLIIADVSHNPRTYETSFPTVENPMSEGGSWIQGGVVGGQWTNMRVSQAGRCIGTQNHTTPNYYSDSHALVAGLWRANHYAEGTVYRAVGNTNEVCLRVRSTISSDVSTGYELLFTNVSNQPVRWNGPIADFSVDRFSGSIDSVGAADGDVIKMSAVGTHLIVYKNGVQIGDLQDIDNMWTTGSPGLQTFQADSDSSNNANFGFSHFKAADL